MEPLESYLCRAWERVAALQQPTPAESLRKARCDSCIAREAGGALALRVVWSQAEPSSASCGVNLWGLRSGGPTKPRVPRRTWSGLWELLRCEASRVSC